MIVSCYLKINTLNNFHTVLKIILKPTLNKNWWTEPKILLSAIERYCFYSKYICILCSEDESILLDLTLYILWLGIYTMNKKKFDNNYLVTDCID